ncbi:MAG: hypothetical protein E7576_09320 [Ruminococcaceae bacterium]|nr:hypothetical protein [Oscillospiraceae bacterium]
MINITSELKAKLLAAQNLAEMAALVKADGQEITAGEAEKLWNEITGRREEADGKELSLCELESISGGGEHRNWVTDGCAATVEYGSWCWSNDKCVNWDVTYDFGPSDTLCIKCGKNMFLQKRTHLGGSKYEEQHRCKFCGCIVISIFDNKDGSNDYTGRQ